MQAAPTPFMRHEYLLALHASGSAVAETGWVNQLLCLRRGDELLGACALYLKSHSYGEYVFDWAWADAYQRHGHRYYPKLLCAAPFTPVPGSRLLARDAATRRLLLQALRQIGERGGLSSAHLLFMDDADRLDAAFSDLEDARKEHNKEIWRAISGWMGGHARPRRAAYPERRDDPRDRRRTSH
jgi:predicted N-acyltransferase